MFKKVFDRSHGAMFALNCCCLLCSIVYSWIALDWKTTRRFPVDVQERNGDDKNFPVGELLNSGDFQIVDDREIDCRTTSGRRSSSVKDNVIKCRVCISSFVMYISRHVSESVKTLVRPRPDNRRALLYLCLIGLALYTFQRGFYHLYNFKNICSCINHIANTL